MAEWYRIWSSGQDLAGRTSLWSSTRISAQLEVGGMDDFSGGGGMKHKTCTQHAPPRIRDLEGRGKKMYDFKACV